MISSFAIDFVGMWALKTRDRDAFLLAPITFIAVLIIGVTQDLVAYGAVSVYSSCDASKRSNQGLDDKAFCGA